ncbi:MAG: hypothetical protein Q4A66_13560, partial [Eubacteriales bacterium]|nr:hypothetical protein [Eubacteriales bacterium]
MLLMLGLCMPAMAMGASAPAYEVVLPDGYAQGEHYPAAYILPQDALAGDDGGIASRLAQAMKEGTCAPMVLVLPKFEAGTDAVAAMKALIEEIDSKYQTLDGKEYRALMGTGAGGYLAYALGLETDLADMLVSIRGDFAGEKNPWLEVYGNLCDKMEEMQLSSPGVFDGYYTYIDAPVDDVYTDMPGSTSDIGALFIGFGTGSAAHEYTVRPGAYTEAFLDESVSRIADRLTRRLFPKEEEPAPVEPVVIDETPVIDGAFQKIELMGEWHFHYAGVDTVLDAANLTKEAFAAWPLVLPGRGHWTKGYGDISDSNVSSAYGPDYFDFFIVGSGYYARTFNLPAEFDGEDVLLSAGYVDDRCEVFLNGVRVGATGMDENGQTTGETTWAVHSLFEIDPDLLVRGGENTIIVRAWNDLPYGAGGWYGGPIGLYSREAYDSLYASKDRFIEESFTSAYAASAQGKKGTIENDYLIYLPKGYEESGRCYPTVYLLHQFNS